MEWAVIRRIAPYFIAVIFVLAVLSLAFIAGVKVTTNKFEAQIAQTEKTQAEMLAQALQNQADANDANLKTALAAERANVEANQKTQVIYKTITETVDHYVQQNPDVVSCDLNADGLSVWNRANKAGASQADHSGGARNVDAGMRGSTVGK